MAYVPGFQYDVFISYASDDFDDQMAQFVRNLGAGLKKRLGKLIDERCVFFDRQELNRTPLEWKRKLEQSAGAAAVLVPLLSPSYATSEYCAKELEWFRDEDPREHPLGWRAGTEEVYRICPVEWFDLDDEMRGNIAPEIRVAQQQRSINAEELGAKIAAGLQLMRRSRQIVYLGETESDLRKSLWHEMSRMGFRVMPEVPQAFGDEILIRDLLNRARLAVHFVGGETAQRTIEAIRHSSQQAQLATVVYELPGHDLGNKGRTLLGWIEDDLKTTTSGEICTYDRISGKNLDQLVQVVRDRLEGARPASTSQIGIAFEPPDLATVETILAEIQRAGFTVTCHGLELLNFKKSRGVLFYWGKAEGKRLRQARLVAEGLCGAFFLAPPPKPALKPEELGQATILHQHSERFTVEDIRPSLQELGWKG